ncbi:MAG: DUF502 domain-containing protein [Planctomycetes bacterium]|nr:DUF502 domain-containing protein [Planctomycetota bacterium]
MHAFKNFRTYFFRGLAALLPTILTLWIFAQGYLFVKGNVSEHVNRGVVWVLTTSFDWYPHVTTEQLEEYAVKQEPTLKSDPAALQQTIQDEEFKDKVRIAYADKYWVDGRGQVAGFIIVLVGVCFLGAFLASVAGRTIWHALEKMLMNAPFVKQVYPHIKQITDFMLTKKKLAFSKVVAVQYPREGVWSLGLVTGTGLKRIVDKFEKEYLTVFVPSSPTPFTGYVIMTPKDETIEVEMAVEEALRFTISGGVITPAEHQAFTALSTNEENKVDDDDV